MSTTASAVVDSGSPAGDGGSSGASTDTSGGGSGRSGGHPGGNSGGVASPAADVAQAVPVAQQKDKCGQFALVCSGWQRSMEFVHENQNTLGHIMIDLIEIDAGGALITGGATLAAGGGVLEVGSGGILTVIAVPAAAVGVTAIAGGGGLVAHGAHNLGKDLGDLHWNNQASGSGIGETANPGSNIGAARETKVADLTNGKVTSGSPGSPCLKVVKPNVGSSDVDITVPTGNILQSEALRKLRIWASCEKCLEFQSTLQMRRRLEAKPILKEECHNQPWTLLKTCLARKTFLFLRGNVSYGEVWWFLGDGGGESLDGAITALRGAGLILGNPATGVPQVIDDHGKQVPWGDVAVQRRLASGECVTMQFWVNRQTDVLVELMLPDRLLTFDLDGMTTAEARQTVFAVLNAALSLTDTQAVVVDGNLPDFGDDLLAAMVGDGSRPRLPFKPDLLLSVEGNGRYRVDVRPDSWLSQPAAIVQSFR